MRQWEDMRDTTGVMDFFAELTMDVDDIRDDANRLHDAAGGDFHLAKITEHEAREICVHELKQAYDLLPDFRMGFIQRVDVVSAISELRQEAAEASTNPLTRLPGSGPKQDYYPIADDAIVSPTLRDIRLQVANLPGAEDSYWSPPSTAQDRADWIAANKEIVKAAARNSGLPPDMVAGIAWQEVGGQPGILDDMTDTIREQADSPLSPIAPESLPWRLGGDPDNTSMGPIAIQVRRGAEVLGYDPEHLTDQQRGMVETALQDPAQNDRGRRGRGGAVAGAVGAEGHAVVVDTSRSAVGRGRRSAMGCGRLSHCNRRPLHPPMPCAQDIPDYGCQRLEEAQERARADGFTAGRRTPPRTRNTPSPTAPRCVRVGPGHQRGGPANAGAMNSKHSSASTAAASTRGAAEAGTVKDEFTMRFSPTPRGARLARRLVAERLDAWGHPHTSTANETLTLITAELTANAVRHGHVPGRDFEVRLTGAGGVLCVLDHCRRQKALARRG